jgi:hypothetical protein
MKLWLDDIREAPKGFVWAKTYTEAIACLEYCRIENKELELADLDNDLGPGQKEGRKVVLWMAENDWWPNEVRIHSANPVAAKYMRGMVERYSGIEKAEP